ncbi:hypothetical protein [Heyndrickxia acidiproducens]|uniref:hypothetical protein n=1 Tax=Heyndrickxia acidiproducens TaxID=1121084 RepID=UPI00035EEF93|nr:hypothetical protein [Heyndrickxia acidiproducens]
MNRTTNDDLKEVSLSENQIRKILHSFIEPYDSIHVRVSETRHQKLSNDQAVELLVRHVNRKGILVIISQLNMIRERHSDILPYIKYILTAVLQRIERSRT